ncbi:MAG TPA: FdhF/YdeP family oxidoreductase [Phycisphaerae bacterium]|nr:FdhF/YdeP family oxidoreductase [Phycisphaerae bacterium]
MQRPQSGGGWPALQYVLDLADRVGWRRLWRAVRTKNACKTCALGMGGQRGAMRNEAGHWPEICKKSFQAMAADMQDGLRPEFFRRYSLAELRSLSARELESAGRIVQPLYAGPGDTHYRVIEWDEALGRVVERFKAATPEQCFFYSSGRSSNEAAFLLQLFARLFGSNHVSNCSYYCHQASGVGLSDSIGTGTATVTLEDVEHADLVFLIGANPASNHPRLMRTLMKIRRTGGHVVVINPLREVGLVNFRVPSDVRSLLFGSPIASRYLQPHAGGDLALLTGIAKAVLERGAIEEDFVRDATEGWEAFREHLIGLTWEAVEQAGGVERAAIEDAAALYANSRNAIFAWTMGITHHEHGVQNVQAIVNLALMRGMIGRPHAGLLPIRGHSNVQGIGSVGVAPKLKEAVFQRLESHFGVRLPTTPGHDTIGCLEAAERAEMKLAWCIGGNLFGATPDAGFASRALGRVDTVVYVNTMLNTTHAWGLGRETMVLPALARDEESQSTTQESMFNYVRLSDGGTPRHPGPRSESSIIADVAIGVLGEGGPVDWRGMKDHTTIREAIARIVPGFEPLADIDQTKQEFHIGGRVLHTPRFPTASGRARFRVHELPSAHSNGRLRLMTIRSEGQFNTVVYEEEDIYRGQDRRDVILMNREDIERLGLRVDQPVVVRSEAGQMERILVREFDIRAGNAAMYYPEANVIVPRRIDPRSRTPAYKSVWVEISPQLDGAVSLTVQRSEIAKRREMHAC